MTHPTDTSTASGTPLLIGTGFWLAGLGCIVGGYPQYAWLPIAWGDFAFRYRAALSSKTKSAS